MLGTERSAGGRQLAPIVVLLAFLAISVVMGIQATAGAPLAEQGPVDSGATAWMLTSTALVLLMVPGLAMFYGGLVRTKNVLGTMMHSFAAMAVVGVAWVVVGFAIAFGPNALGGLIGWDPNLVMMKGIDGTVGTYAAGVPDFVFAMFQGKFAIITPALISGAIAERVRFPAFVLFTFLWATLVYCPLAHWVWSPDGWLCKLGVLDFAGGTVVHISAGVSALVLALLIGPRRDYVPGQASVVPHNLPFTLLGAGLLWFGWFGFNAGSAVGLPGPVAGPAAALAFTTTQTAAAGAALSWLLYEWIRHGKPTSLGLASGIIAGLVAITPAAGFVTPLSALLIGLMSGIVCCVAVSWKARLRYDDSLDAFGVHGVGGMLGAVLTGALCFTPVAASGAQVGKQALGVGVGIATAIVGTLLVTAFVRVVTPLRASDEEERDGLDITTHGERAYHAAIGH